MRSASAILRSLSLRRIQPAAVAPLPATTQFSRELTAELNTLLATSGEHGNGMAQLLDAAITTQKIALNSLARVPYAADVDLGALEEYLETNTDILDACNCFVERIEDTKKHYVDSLRKVARFVGSNNDEPSSRALERLESCEKRLRAMEKRGLMRRRTMLRQKLVHDTEFSEIVCGSKVVALLCCMFLEHSLSFDCSKGGFPMMKCQCHLMSCSWLRLVHELVEGSGEKKRGCLVMQTVSAARELKEEIEGKRGKEMVGSCVERVRRSCRELECGLDFVEGKVRDFYKSLIDVRMALMGILSQA